MTGRSFAIWPDDFDENGIALFETPDIAGDSFGHDPKQKTGEGDRQAFESALMHQMAGLEWASMAIRRMRP